MDLGNTQEKRAGQAVPALFRSKSAAQRLRAVQELARAVSDESRELLRRALFDRSNLVVAEAAKALAAHGDREAAPLMIERYYWFAADGLRRDPGCAARWQLVTALASFGDHRAADVFFDAIETVQVEPSGAGLEDMAAPLRAQAAMALAELAPPGALVAIALLLFDDQPKAPTAPQHEPFATLATRRVAARALASLGDPGGAAVLALKLRYPGNEVPEVLVECMDALVALDEQAALKLIPQYLEHRHPYLATGAATALATLRGSAQGKVLEMLLEACHRQSQEAREGIALAIASMRGDEAIHALERLAKADDPSVRLASVSALAHKGGPASEVILSRLAKDPDAAVARRAAGALQALHESSK